MQEIIPDPAGIVPPKESTKPKNKIVPPIESTKPPKKTIAQVYSKWSYAYFYLICVASLLFLNRPNYLTEIFPILVYVGFIVLFVNHLIWSKRLGFCTFKKCSTIALVLYFLTCILAIIFKLNIYVYFGYFFAVCGFGLFLFTIKDKKNVG